MKKWIIGIVVFLVIATVVGLNIAKNIKIKNGKEVEVLDIKKTNFATSFSISGKVFSDDVSVVKATDMLKIDKRFVEVGDEVAAGEKMFDIDFTEFEKQVEALEDEVEVTELNLEKLTSTKVSSTSGASDIAKAELALETAETEYNNSVDLLNKNKELYKIGAVSKEKIESLEDAVERNKNNIDNAKYTISSLKENTSSKNIMDYNTSVSKDIDKKIVDKKIETLKQNIKDLQEKIADAKEIQYAKISGTVTMIIDENQDTVMKEGVIAQVSDLSKLIVKATVKENDSAKISVGNKVIVKSEGLTRDEKIEGTVRFISPVARTEMTKNGERAVLDVEIELNPGTSIKAGFDVECKVLSQELKDVLTLSFDTLIKENEKDYVYLVDEDNKIKKVEVVLGAKADFDSVVLSGISEGDRVIINPDLTLLEGTKVKIKKD